MSWKNNGLKHFRCSVCGMICLIVILSYDYYTKKDKGILIGCFKSGFPLIKKFFISSGKICRIQLAEWFHFSPLATEFARIPLRRHNFGPVKAVGNLTFS
jgi:hypothetical protein